MQKAKSKLVCLGEHKFAFELLHHLVSSWDFPGAGGTAACFAWAVIVAQWSSS